MNIDVDTWMMIGLACVACVCAPARGQAAGEPEPGSGDPGGAVPPGWRLAVQAWSFHRFTFFEAVDKVASLGLHYIEAYPGQRIAPDSPETLHHTMGPEARRRVLEKLRAAGVRWVNYGVVGTGSEEEWRSLFAFAREVGIETLVSEPEPAQMDFLEKLCDEHQVNLAIHNHPKPSRYWNPDTVLEAVQGRSRRLGACADTGHWVRSGLSPLACLRKLEGRILSLHFKDLNEASPEAHDVPWGSGISDVHGLLTELKRQGFQGVFSVEYEHHWENSLPEIRECVEYFNRASATLE